MLELSEELAANVRLFKKLSAFSHDSSRPRLWNCHAIGGVMEPETTWEQMSDIWEAKDENSDTEEEHCRRHRAEVEGQLEIKPNITMVPASQHFSSLEEARLKLAYGRFIEHQWECIVAEDLCKGDFTAAFIHVADKVVLACIRRKYDGAKLDRAALDEHMAIGVHFDETYTGGHGQEVSKKVKASGSLTSNHVNVNCDFVVMPGGKIPRPVYYKTTRVGRPPRFIDVELTIDMSKSLPRTMSIRSTIALIAKLVLSSDFGQHFWRKAVRKLPL